MKHLINIVSFAVCNAKLCYGPHDTVDYSERLSAEVWRRIEKSPERLLWPGRGDAVGELQSYWNLSADWDKMSNAGIARELAIYRLGAGAWTDPDGNDLPAAENHVRVVLVRVADSNYCLKERCALKWCHEDVGFIRSTCMRYSAHRMGNSQMRVSYFWPHSPFGYDEFGLQPPQKIKLGLAHGLAAAQQLCEIHVAQEVSHA